MLKTIKIIALFLLTANFVVAQDIFRHIEIDAYTSYKKEDFRWSIAGNLQGTSPNIYSELVWKNIRGPGFGAALKLNVWDNLQVTASYNRSKIKAGAVTDTDYQADNRQQPTYNAKFPTNEGNNYAIEGGMGYTFFADKTINLTPTIGYLHDKQNLIIKGNTPGSTLNSTYQTRWSGPFLGLNANSTVLKKLVVGIALNYYQVNYYAKANWNSIDAFAHPISFEHDAKGYIIKTQLHISYPVIKSLSIVIKGGFNYAVTAAGTDHLFLADGGELFTRFNEAVRKGSEIGGGIRLAF